MGTSSIIQTYFDKGLRYHKAGYTAKAVRIYKTIIWISPDNPNLWGLLGVALGQIGSHDSAFRIFRRALNIDPYHATTQLNFGNHLKDQGEFSSAANCYNAALILSPGFLDAWISSAILLSLCNEGEASALLSWTKAQRLLPENPEFRLNQGAIYNQLKQHREATTKFQEALILAPDSIEGWRALITVTKKPIALLEAYRKVLRIEPGCTKTRLNRAFLSHQLNRSNDAIKDLTCAIIIDPQSSSFYSNLGEVQKDTDFTQVALQSLNRAIIIQPNLAEAHLNRGGLLQSLGHLIDARIELRLVLALQPEWPEAWITHSICRSSNSEWDKAEEDLDRAIIIDPENADAHSNKSLILRLKGDLKQGYMEAEWRWKTTAYRPYYRNLDSALWLGEESLVGKSILVTAEQGFGDCIQFIRYIAFLSEMASSVYIEMYPALLRLFENFVGSYHWISMGDPLPKTDFYCPVMSLPLAFQTTLDSIPGKSPYLCVTRSDPGDWARRLGPKHRPRIGLAWSGSINLKNDRCRSLLFTEVECLTALSSAEFHVIQKEVRDIDRPFMDKCGCIQFHGEELNDFKDTADLINEMDLVISVDTSVAHLAGAMAKPVWILLARVPDFRWLLDREDTPWYPSARLYRQEIPGEWGTVIARIKTDLESFIFGATY